MTNYFAILTVRVGGFNFHSSKSSRGISLRKREGCCIASPLPPGIIRINGIT